MNGPSTIYFAESLAEERAHDVERRAAEAALLEGITAPHPVRTRLGNGLIKVGMRLAPHPGEPLRKMHTSPSS